MRIEQLTFFRFIAAAIVVIFHFGQEATGLKGFAIAGPEMVTFFFVLSGFVLGISYLNRSFEITDFWWARISRIAPIYLLALGLKVVLDFAAGGRPSYTGLGLSMGFLQAWVPQYALTVNKPGWSISVEMFFYVSFPFVLIWIKQMKVNTKALLFFAVSLWALTQLTTISALSADKAIFPPEVMKGLVMFFPLTHFCSFLLGIAAACFFIEKKPEIKSYFWSSALVVGCGWLIVYLIDHQYPIEDYVGLEIPFGSSFYAPLFMVFIILLSLCRGPLNNLLNAKLLVLLGEASYSLYILQNPLNKFYRLYIEEALNFSPLANFVTYFVFLLLCSIAAYLMFEKTVNRFLRKHQPSFLKRIYTRQIEPSLERALTTDANIATRTGNSSMSTGG